VPGAWFSGRRLAAFTHAPACARRSVVELHRLSRSALADGLQQRQPANRSRHGA